MQKGPRNGPCLGGGAEGGIRTPTLLRAPAPQALVAGDHIGSGQCLSDGFSEREVRTRRSQRLDSHKFAHGTWRYLPPPHWCYVGAGKRHGQGVSNRDRTITELSAALYQCTSAPASDAIAAPPVPETNESFVTFER